MAVGVGPPKFVVDFSRFRAIGCEREPLEGERRLRRSVLRGHGGVEGVGMAMSSSSWSAAMADGSGGERKRTRPSLASYGRAKAVAECHTGSCEAAAGRAAAQASSAGSEAVGFADR